MLLGMQSGMHKTKHVLMIMRQSACMLIKGSRGHLADGVVEVSTADEVIRQSQVPRREARQRWTPEVHHNLHQLRMQSTCMKCLCMAQSAR